MSDKPKIMHFKCVEKCYYKNRVWQPGEKVEVVPNEQGPPAEYGERLVKECQAKREAVLPLNDPQCEFLGLLLKKGEIDPSILTPDQALHERIQNQLLLQWKALTIKRHKGLD